MILIDSHPRHDWLVKAVDRRLREELAKLQVEINEEKSRMVDLAKGESFAFLGFEFRRILSRNRVWRPYYAPKLKKRTALFAKLREVFRRHRQPACGEGDRADQPDPAGLGELLCGLAIRVAASRMVKRLGRKEGPAAPDACPETQGLRLETVE